MLCKITIFAFLFLTLTAGVCEMEWEISQPVDFSEVIGTYEAKHDSALVDRLELKPDSTYVRFFVSIDGKDHTDTGRFWFSYLRNDARRASIGFLQFRHRFARRAEPTSSRDYYPADSLPTVWATGFFKYEDGRLRIRRPTLKESYFKVR